jgi:hypothetical protein
LPCPVAALHVGGDAIVEEQLRVKDYVSSAGLRVSRYASGPFTTTPTMSRFADIDETRSSFQYCSNMGAWCSNAIGGIINEKKIEVPDVSSFVTRQQVVDIFKDLVEEAIDKRLKAYLSLEEASERFVTPSSLKCYPTNAQVHGAFVRKQALSEYVTHDELAKVGLDLRGLPP